MICEQSMSQITSNKKVSRVVSSKRHPKSWDTRFARKQNVSGGMQTPTHIKINGLTGSLRKALQTDECGQKLVRGTSSTVTSRQQTELYHDGHVPTMQVMPLRLQGSASGCNLSRVCSVA